MAAKVFTLLAEAGVNVDMIVQASASTGTADISFTVPGSAAAKVRDVLQEKQDELGYQSFDIDANGPARAAAGRRPRAAHCLRLGCRAGGSRGVWRYWSLTQYRAITIKKDLTGLLEASQPSLFYSHICFTDIFSDNLQMKKRRIAE